MIACYSGHRRRWSLRRAYVLFIRDRTLMARPFDADKIEFTGDPFPVAETVALLPPGTVVGVFSASQNGVLAYQTGDGSDGNFRLIWRDREGNELGAVGEPASYDEVHLIPGGELAVVASRGEANAGTGDVWVVDLRRNLFSQIHLRAGLRVRVDPDPRRQGADLLRPIGKGLRPRQEGDRRFGRR